jgi:CubicO group peptidase (beta-lactamase class C family)
MMPKLLLSLVVYFSFIFISFADHGPKKMWKRQIVPYFDAHETKMMGKFKINIHAYGKKKNVDAANVKKENFDNIFKDKFNLAALIRKNNEIVYARYNKKRNIDNNTILHGMSMSKTALSTAVGTLLCNGKIASLDDELGKYSPSLANTPFSKISIKNTLQMNSGVEPLQSDYKFRRKLNQMAMGMRKYEGKADMVKALSILKGNDREQGSKHFYNSSDPFALSIMITDLTKKPASQIFYENAFKKFSTNNFMHWVSDKKGITVAQARLTMTATDWSNFGQFVHDEMKNNTCLGKFYKEGIENAVETTRDGVKYGYQFWVYNVNGQPTLTMTGHGGFFNIINTSKNTILTMFSVDENYKYGNLFSKGVISKIAEEIN